MLPVMNFYPSSAPLVGFVALLLLVNTKLFASADVPPSQHPARLQTIDGLRGFLALSVVFYHGAIYHRYLQDGAWVGPPSSFYTLLGTSGVAVFFMITGYLFWGRLIDERGRPNWIQLYIGRVFRIAPLYLIMILGMVILIFAETGWQLKVPFSEFVRQLAPWLALGLLDPTGVNAYPATIVLTAGVAWSLRYEWLFYLILPMLALAAKRVWIRIATVLIAITAAFLWSVHGGPHYFAGGDPYYVTLFLIGIVCATADRSGWTARIGNRAASMAIIALLATMVLTCPIAYSPLAMALLGTCFYLIVSGCTLFGLLAHKAAKRLGDISYGIYLLQGLVLAGLFHFQGIRSFALTSPHRHWAIILSGAALLVSFATITHVWIERPGISLGKRLSRMILAQAAGLHITTR
jgi:peptidoglycan/LPS O-acetylase OafA/YrhL